MSDFILTTKLYVPLPQPELVSRPRLIKKLSEGLPHKLTLISAPAGFGKTTLVSNWIASMQLDGEKGSQLQGHASRNIDRVAWLSLDDGDNDLHRFFFAILFFIDFIR